jgi:prefoldin subunit 5
MTDGQRAELAISLSRELIEALETRHSAIERMAGEIDRLLVTLGGDSQAEEIEEMLTQGLAITNSSRQLLAMLEQS